ncbi:MAG: lipoate--protein ligase family protein [Planctomycetes bacterium]|nr:lipoate--protein ligase family protein [Planctomycetota bacterium]
MQEIRLLIDSPLHGPANMARDEVLLQPCEAHASGPVLRFYAWCPPTISLGYFQDIVDFETQPSPINGLDVVRRTTGGGAILHDLEVTYSLVLPIDHTLIHNKPNRLYSLAHDAIIRAMDGEARLYGCGNGACDESAQRGPFFCFARRHGLDVVIHDGAGTNGVSKIAGSAQRRTRRAVLQHGSIMLDSRFAQQPIARWKQVDPRIDVARAIKRLVSAFEESFEMPTRPSRWTPDELAAAIPFEKQYGSEEWTRHRRRLTA